MKILVIAFALLLQQAIGSRSLQGCKWTCNKSCATCTSISEYSATENQVTIDLSACKNGGTVDWMCCKSPGCTMYDCDGNSINRFTISSKCDDLTKSIYIVPKTSTTLQVQYHDSKLAGNVICDSTICCGESTSRCPNAQSGVCNQTIDLNSCSPLSCSVDGDCATLRTEECGKQICENQECVQVPKSQGIVCRSVIYGCNKPEYCTGTTLDCPTHACLPPVAIQCRVDGDCATLRTDECGKQVCDNRTSWCVQVHKSQGVVCRSAVDDCDEPEYCTGTTLVCPSDVYSNSSKLCRQVVGDRDEPEYCTGISTSCPGNISLLEP
jgi:hypothetical protein